MAHKDKLCFSYLLLFYSILSQKNNVWLLNKESSLTPCKDEDKDWDPES